MATNNVITFAKAMKEDMEAYGREVNFNRAIVDISGLKRVQLRILYTMYKMKLYPNKPRAKSPDIVGNVIQLHPHADTAIYDAMVRLAQPWTLNYPLIDFKGSIGSEDGDPAAASRYTEARLSVYGMALIQGIEDTSPYVLDYADHGMEPEFLVPAFPSLFVNISKGIGVAAACNFLPHKLSDISAAVKQRMDGASEAEIISNLYPTFPTGGILLNGADLPSIYKTGSGSVKIRAKHSIKGNEIVFTELPYQVSRTAVIDMIQERKDARILSVYDTSDMKQKSITFEVRHNVDKEAFVEELFKTTRLEDSFNVNMTIHNRVKVERRSFISLLDEYIQQQHQRLISIASAARLAAEEKKHKLEGFVIILPNIDRVYEISKTSDTDAEASKTLQSEFGITEIQAKSVLAIRLGQLTRRGVESIKEEIASLEAEITSQRMIEEDADLRKKMVNEQMSSILDTTKFTMKVEMGSIPQNVSSTVRSVTATNGDRLELADEDEILVVTANKRGYRIKGKQLDKMPKETHILLHTPEWIAQQTSLDLFGTSFDPQVIIVQCKSARGANLKI